MERVDDFGGELAAEYQYQRYERTTTPADTLTSIPDQPFLTFQLRSGVVLGTNSFYRSIGHSNASAFVYTVPTLSLNFKNGVRVGVAYFYGFGDFKQNEALRFQLTLAPPQKPERTEQSERQDGANR